jgi:hypothetical protein
VKNEVFMVTGDPGEPSGRAEYIGSITEAWPPTGKPEKALPEAVFHWAKARAEALSYKPTGHNTVILRPV